MNRIRSNYLLKHLRAFNSSSQIYTPRKFRSDSLSKHTNQFGEYSIIRPNQYYRKKISDLDINTVIPEHITKPDYAYTSQPADWSEFIELKDDEVLLEDFKEACQLASRALKFGGSLCLEGVTTDHIDEKVREYIINQGGYPSTLNYMGFPNSICTSINNVICHGIPDSRPLHNGDIINIDVTVYYKGFHGDNSATFLVGQVDELGLELTEVTKLCLDKAIGICGPEVPLKEIGSVIEETARKYNFSVSEELTGHGIGRMFHEIPLIFHHENEEPGHMLEGMSFTIEPILCQGTNLGMKWDDNWTIVTKDGGRSAQFEHTIIVTPDGAEILTK